jgi:hypothetical protein
MLPMPLSTTMLAVVETYIASFCLVKRAMTSIGRSDTFRYENETTQTISSEKSYASFFYYFIAASYLKTLNNALFFRSVESLLWKIFRQPVNAVAFLRPRKEAINEHLAAMKGDVCHS